MPDTWILVADTARARLFSLGDGADQLEEIGDYINAAARTPGHELEHGPPSRVHDRFGDSRHAIDSSTPPREKIAAKFAGVLASKLEHGSTAHRCGKLVLIAPPRFLGALHTALGERLRKTVVLEVPKNLTRRNTAAIRAEIPERLVRHTGRAVW